MQKKKKEGKAGTNLDLLILCFRRGSSQGSISTCRI